MALLNVRFQSKCLKSEAEFNLLLPNDTTSDIKLNNKHYKRQAKTLLLLHGYTGSAKDFLLESKIAALSAKYNLAVVMPNGENYFYLDCKGTGREYSKFIGKELIGYLRGTFNLANKKEDTFIGGFSMGGFGAIHAGLQFPETFEKVAALSPALIIHQVENMKEGENNSIADYYYYSSVFGDLDKLDESESNPEFLIKKNKANGTRIPPIFQCCGSEDFLIEPNREFHKFLVKENVNVTYKEGEGVHNWDYWNANLEPSINWLLGEKGAKKDV